MALTAIQSNFISDSANIAKQLLALEGPLDQLNTLWAGSPAFNAAINQSALDGTNFAANGLTALNLTDAEFALATILTNIKNALPALVVLARQP